MKKAKIFLVILFSLCVIGGGVYLMADECTEACDQSCDSTTDPGSGAWTKCLTKCYTKCFEEV
jgi:hypothetical protein